MDPEITSRLARVMSASARREVVVFAAVGGTAAVLYVILNWLFVSQFGLHPALAIVATLCVLVPPTYLVQRNFTFRSNRNHRTAFPRYVATQALGSGIAFIAAASLPSVVVAYPFAASCVLAGTVAISNFLILKLFIFQSTS